MKCELIDNEKNDSLMQVHEMRQFLGTKYGIVEYWYKNIKPDYKLDSLKVIFTSDKRIKRTHKYKFKNE
ncbi:MAG: hypothetical protein GY756_03955 [bacterium]|nr:hypothetical protein [bacterium]